MASTILGLLSGVLGVAKILLGMAEKRQLLKAGEAKAISKNLTSASERVRRARKIQSSVTDDNADSEL